ncbi:MAG: hypothetical protein ACOC35_00775 [Promethearchaeia archaeon]
MRLPLEILKIRLDDRAKSFLNFISDIIETASGRKFRTKLKEVLIDTGNEANYLVLSAYYLNPFKNKIKDIAVEQQILEDFRGNKRITDVSTDIFEFQIFNATFKSRIGFTYQTSINALDIINIGITGIAQFLNILFLFKTKNYYYCTELLA